MVILILQSGLCAAVGEVLIRHTLKGRADRYESRVEVHIKPCFFTPLHDSFHLLHLTHEYTESYNSNFHRWEQNIVISIVIYWSGCNEPTLLLLTASRYSFIGHACYGVTTPDV